jgi:hypothetical protein
MLERSASCLNLSHAMTEVTFSTASLSIEDYQYNIMYSL